MASEAVTTDSYSHVKACTVGLADTIIRFGPSVCIKSVVAVRNALLLEPVHSCCTATVTLQHVNICAKRGHRCYAECCSESLSSVYDARVCKRIVSYQPISSWLEDDNVQHHHFTVVPANTILDNYDVWFMNSPIGFCSVMDVKNKTTFCGDLPGSGRGL
jgi:hypothetical protein